GAAPRALHKQDLNEGVPMSSTTTDAEPRSAEPTRARPRRIQRTQAWLTALPFLLPAFLLLALLRIVPMLQAIGEAVPLGTARSPLSNFAYIFTDPSFWNAVAITLVFAVIINPVQIVLALALAVVLTRRLPWSGFWRTLILLPIAVP